VDFLLHAVRTVLDGGMFFASRQSPRTKSAEEAQALPSLPLTAREQQIARMVAAGKPSKEIARELGLSVRTVEKHRANLMAKIGVREVASLTRWCLQAGLLTG
jgi:DNA-binding NarL/FixJ family response regulator